MSIVDSQFTLYIGHVKNVGPDLYVPDNYTIPLQRSTRWHPLRKGEGRETFSFTSKHSLLIPFQNSLSKTKIGQICEAVERAANHSVAATTQVPKRNGTISGNGATQPLAFANVRFVFVLMAILNVFHL